MAGEKIRFRLPGKEDKPDASRVHARTSRAAAAPVLLDGVEVRRHYDLSAKQRSANAHVETPPLDADDLLAVEMEGGFILYTSAGRLADDLRRTDPEAARRSKAKHGDVLTLEALRRRVPATRGLGEWLVRALSVLDLDDRSLVVKAAEKAKELGGEILLHGASWAGTKAILWAIEQQLEPKPGLYPWGKDLGDGLLAPEPVAQEDIAPAADVLVFIHGAASSTRGSFGELGRPDAAAEWQALRRRFGDHIYGFEHRTFSESPIENALALARALPPRARLSIVAHSRGGLVGDLLAATGLGDLLAGGFARSDLLLAPADEEDRKNLRALDQLLGAKQFHVERYVRVAAPAQGALLASSHIDAFLSVLLHLIGLVPGLAGSPAYAVAMRVLLQIAKNRTDPRLVPGVEAMLPDSPLLALIGRAEPQPDAEIAVVAGDIDGGGVLKRLGVLLTDYLLFEAQQNDLIVDTASMFGGIARDAGRYVFDQGEDVSHFRYFANARTRRSLQNWLVREDVASLTEFRPIHADVEPVAMQRGIEAVGGARPVVVFLPGTMGSHLKADDDRIWFDFLDIALGRLPRLAWDRTGIAPDGLFEMFYGDLCDHLLLSHDVLTFAYDWRRPLADDAAALAELVERALAKTAAAGQPVRLMAHSLGGLVVRAMIANHRATWDRLVARAGGRFVMLGTPNRGSHGTVEALLGLAGSIRKLALLDAALGLQEIVDLVAAFPGAVQLLPRPGFRDTGGSRHDYYSEAFWSEFKQGNDSFWYGENIGAAPASALLSATKEAWQVLDEDLPNPDRISYVAGYGYETPCGIERETEPSPRLRMVGTLAGDGTVTHDSGLLEVLERNRRVWFMDADHVALTDTAEHFPALVDLLERGESNRLPQTRPALRGAEHTFRYEAGPVLYPTREELERSALGGRRPTHRQAKASQVLTVSCRAMDLRHAIDPILVGHYEGDAIAGAEAQLDRVLDNRLTLRHHLDAYAGPAGSVAVVLDEPNEEQARVGIRRGAVVIGFGDFGSLTPASLTAGVQQAVLRYLLQLHDRSIEREPPASIGLASLLLGFNSTTSISIDDSVALVTRGVMQANRQFAESAGVPLRVERLEFVELFEDTAISAAKAVRSVATRLEREARRLGFRIEAPEALACGAGMRSRLEATPSSFGHWPRLIVTDPEASRSDGAGSATSSDRSRHPRSLRYVYLSMRARAETVEHQRQPAAVDRLIATSIRNPRYRRETARALFNLLVPEELKATVRQNDNLVLVVDASTASLPWETLVADEEPLIKSTAMVRQFASTTFRHHVRPAREKRAYVVGNPSTAGFYAALGRGTDPVAPPAPDGEIAESATARKDALPDLPGAASEARAVADILTGAGFEVAESPPGEDGMSVIERLYQRPYRIVHMAAHGVFALGEGAERRTGVVLSDGLMLTAAEIAALDVVPDLVFLNCCHTGRIDSGPAPAYNRLAASIARELIECGVRVVIAAGWAVDDDAASFFAERFYQAFVHENRPFGPAVQTARLATYESFTDSNTWGAFQAYGEPSFVIDPTNLVRRGAEDFQPVAPQELVARIEILRNDLPCDPRGAAGVDMKELGDRVDALLRQGGSEAWNEEQEVLYVLGRLYADAGDFESARRRYEQAIAREDKRARVPIAAIEQLANMEVREGVRQLESEDEGGEALIRRGLARMLALARAASGTEDLQDAAVSPERCALIGSAYKRLAKALPAWRSAATDGPRGGIRDALEQSRNWYAKAEGDPARSDFRPYESQNRIALDAVLGIATAADAALAVRTGEAAAKRYARSRDQVDLVMGADGLLLARLVEGALAKSSAAAAQAIEREIVARYLRLWEDLPIGRERDSVLSQIDLLAHFFALRVDDDGTRHDGEADRLRRIAAALRGEVPAATAIDLAHQRRERASPRRDERAARSPERKTGARRRTRKQPRAKR